MKARTFALAGVTLVAVACGGQGGGSATDEPRRYIIDICEPFATYFEDAIEIGFPDFESVTTLDDLLVLSRSMGAISEKARDDFSAVRPPQAIRDTHEQVMAAIEAEIGAYQLIETALESGDESLLSQALEEADQSFGLAGIGATGFFPGNVPEGYEEAWVEECTPRLRQIPGIEG